MTPCPRRRTLPRALRKERESSLAPGVAEGVLFSVWGHLDSTTRQELSHSCRLFCNLCQESQFKVELDSVHDIMPKSRSEKYIFIIDQVYFFDGTDERVLQGVVNEQGWNTWHEAEWWDKVLQFNDAQDLLCEAWIKQRDQEDTLEFEEPPFFYLIIRRKRVA